MAKICCLWFNFIESQSNFVFILYILCISMLAWVLSHVLLMYCFHHTGFAEWAILNHITKWCYKWSFVLPKTVTGSKMFYVLTWLTSCITMNSIGMVAVILEWNAALKFYEDLHYFPIIFLTTVLLLSWIFKPPAKKTQKKEWLFHCDKWYVNYNNEDKVQAPSSKLIIWKTFSMRSENYLRDILLSPFSSISSKISSTSSRVGLSTPISLAICTRTCSNYPLSRKPEPSMSTLRKASSISFFIFLASFIICSNFFSFAIQSNNI